MSPSEAASWLSLAAIFVSVVFFLLNSVQLKSLADTSSAEHACQVNRIREKEEIIARDLLDAVETGADHLQEVMFRHALLAVHGR